MLKPDRLYFGIQNIFSAPSNCQSLGNKIIVRKEITFSWFKSGFFLWQYWFPGMKPWWLVEINPTCCTRDNMDLCETVCVSACVWALMHMAVQIWVCAPSIKTQSSVCCYARWAQSSACKNRETTDRGVVTPLMVFFYRLSYPKELLFKGILCLRWCHALT